VTQEIERKFLLEHLPDLIDDHEPTRIAQGYLARGDEVEVRVRARGDDRLLTVKGGHGAVRTEVSVTLSPEQFDALWPLTDGQRITKRRWVIPKDGVEYEIDVFDGDLDGLKLVEVEFDTAGASAAFTPPDWFGPEVTDDSRYRNASLARHGAPAAAG
jgi:CYTH domain-containing protein